MTSSDSAQQRAVRVLVRVCQPHSDPKSATLLAGECCRAVDQRTLRLQNPRKHGSVDATYHSVFAPGAPQAAVHDTVRQIVDDALAGVNSCIMAYGPTGTGKTHTMIGPPNILAASGAGMSCVLEEHGLIPRLVSDLFKRKAATAFVTVSYIEIYNDSIVDLLEQRDNDKYVDQKQRSKVTVWEDSNGVTHMRKLRKASMRSLADATRLLRFGAQQRSVRHTALNQHSSRGHTILQVQIENRPNADDPHVVRSKINFVDLAGSEPHPGGPVTASSHAAETKSINVSLSALISVVCALARGKSRVHVPYRDSKLTTVLKDSLGGNCSTWVIITLSAASSAYQETHSTLQFANRVAAVMNNVTVNECNDVEGVLAAKDEEILRLRTMIQQLTDTGMASKSASQSTNELQHKISGLKQELRAERLRVHQLEARRNITLISSSRSSLSGGAPEAITQRCNEVSGTVGDQGPCRNLPPPPRLSDMRPDLQKLFSLYKSAPRRPSSSCSSRPSTGGGKSRSKPKLPHAVSQERGKVYTDALQHHAAAPSHASSSKRRPKLKGPQTLKDLGQQLIRDHRKRLADAGSVPSSFPHYGFSSEKRLLSLAAAGGDMTHLNQLLARYKVLSKELANTKVSALQQVESNGTPSPVRWLNTTKSLDALQRLRSSSLGDRIPSSASWPEAVPQGPCAARSLEPGGRSFGLSSVISMPKPNVPEQTDAACPEPEVNRESGCSQKIEHPEKRGFGLSALLRGGSIVPKQIGGMITAQPKTTESTVT